MTTEPKNSFSSLVSAPNRQKNPMHPVRGPVTLFDKYKNKQVAAKIVGY